MKKISIIILLQAVFVMMDCFGQDNKQGSLYLTDYTFSANKNEIGFIKLRNAGGDQIRSIGIEGEHSKAFRISKNNMLSISRKMLTQEANWLDIVLNVTTTEGGYQDTVRIVKDQFIRNKVVAHRGAWKNTGASENSIAALNHAIAMGCEGSEFDVHMSSDSIPFINHDADIQGVSIARSASGLLHNIKLSNGETFPTLEDYLRTGVQQNKTKLVLEIKPSSLGKESSIALAHKVVKLVERLHAQAWVDYISFDYDVCKEVMKSAPYARAAYLNGDKNPMELAKDKFYGLDYNISVFQKNPDWIKNAQQKKLTVNVWTVNDKELMKGLLRQNVDFITTNEPEMLLNLVSGK